MTSETNDHGVIWVSSYPKSGNTWMRFVLTYMFADDIKSSADVDSLIPEAMIMPGYKLTIPDDRSVLLKTHWKMDLSLPLMNRTKGFVYLVRNPLDVMTSLFHFNRLRYFKGDSKPTEKEIRESRSRYISAFIQHHGNPLVGHGGGHTSWVDNVSSWVSAAQEYPCVIVRYEDMLTDPKTEISRVATFFNKELSDVEIGNIVTKTSFKSMKKMEDKEIRGERQGFFFRHGLKAHALGGRFMRQGKSGEGKQYIDAHVLQQFFDAFEEIMRVTGYKVNRNTGVVRTVPYKLDKVTPLSSCPVIGRATIQ